MNRQKGCKNILSHEQLSGNLHTSKNLLYKHRKAGRITVSTRQQMLMQSLTDFFSKPHNIEQFKQMVKKGAPLSLRVIDWFVTNYSRDNEIIYAKGHDWTKTGYTGDNQSKNALESSRMINVHESYKAQLKAYSKRQFDPFCRRDRINFYYTPTECIETTVGQLNFFRWAIENDIIVYVKFHRKQVEDAMRVYVRGQREARRKLAKKGKHIATSNETNNLIGGGKTRRRSVTPVLNSCKQNSMKTTDSNHSAKQQLFTNRSSTTVYFY